MSKRFITCYLWKTDNNFQGIYLFEVNDFFENGNSNGYFYQGDLLSEQVGITARLGNGLVVGMSVNFSESEVKYKNSSENRREINFSVSMTGINPNFGFISSGGNSRLQTVAPY